MQVQVQDPAQRSGDLAEILALPRDDAYQAHPHLPRCHGQGQRTVLEDGQGERVPNLQLP